VRRSSFGFNLVLIVFGVVGFSALARYACQRQFRCEEFGGTYTRQGVCLSPDQTIDLN
jgi:hypothetical protein